MKVRPLGAAASVIALTALLAPTADAVDKPDRIIDGTIATSTQGSVALHAKDVTGIVGPAGDVIFKCSASLVDADTVLTARHCVDDDRFPTDHLRVGSLKRASGGTVHQPSKIEIHPGADLAVITLETPAQGAPTVTLTSERPPIGETNPIYGWGKTSCSEPEPSPVLKTANVRFTGITSDYYGGIALGSTGINGTAWQGDSGGPQFGASGEQVGVASTAICSETQAYTSVADYRTWITDRANG
ncbi:S1 family peptidase [Demetria terragena]|uniref:S1 family peptidase n=1 Tax=Demetria terragena TaxID=63959 RepID=UPI0003694DCA|nr:trypsin-like serine protease [Demetria terragena]